MPSSIHRRFLLLLCLVPLSLGARDCERVVLGSECEHDGELIAIGTEVKSEDGCNTCRCGPDGELSCTSRACGDVCGGLQGLSCDEGEFCDFAIDAECGAADQTGTCEEIPEACTQQYDPVCGCDGETYGNACTAASAGVSVASEGECDGGGDGCRYDGMDYEVGDSFPSDDGCNTCSCSDGGLVACTERACGQTCGSRGLEPCPEDEYCSFAVSADCGATDRPGHCVPIPEACTLEYNPVCGCDGETYGNDCAAAMDGVSVASPGECGSQGDGCSYDGEEYEVGESFPATDGCNTCDCLPDGSVACTDIGCADQCGGLQGLSCDDSEYCDYPIDAQCGAADQTGTCQPIPDACDLIYDPVCGCDGNTYGNDCEAAMQGVSVASEGECGSQGGGCSYNGEDYEPGESFPSDDGCNTCTCTEGGLVACTERACLDFCGGLIGAGCADGEYCDYPIDAQCGAADQTGSCELIPDACTLEYDPVCGCDGNTYGNACAAAAEGVSVASEGPC